jgi:hypothetical protein
VPEAEAPGWSARRTLVAAAFPMALMVVYAWTFAARIPIWDGWSWIHQLELYQSGEKSLVDVLSYVHIEHPYGVPTVLFILLGRAFDYRFDAFGVLNALVLCLTTVTILLALHRAGLTRTSDLLLVGALLLSLRQSQNVLWGFQLGFPLTVALGLAAVVAADKIALKPEAAQIGGWAAALLILRPAALLSSGGGAAVCLAAALRLSSARNRHARRALAALIGITLLWFRWYWVVYRNGPPRPREAGGLRDGVLGFLSVCGGGLTDHRAGSVGMGAVILVAFGALLRRPRRPIHGFGLFIGVGALSLGLAGIVTLGRGGMAGIVPGHYSTFTLPLAGIALGLWLVRLRALPRFRRSLAITACWVLCGSLLVINTRKAWLFAQEQRARNAALTSIMLAPEQTREEIALLNPGPTPLIASLVQFLKDRGYNVFAQPGSSSDPAR